MKKLLKIIIYVDISIKIPQTNYKIYIYILILTLNDSTHYKMQLFHIATIYIDDYS